MSFDRFFTDITNGVGVLAGVGVCLMLYGGLVWGVYEVSTRLCLSLGLIDCFAIATTIVALTWGIGRWSRPWMDDSY